MMFEGLGSVSWLPIAVFCFGEYRTQDAGHALLRQGRNPKVRKNSGVIENPKPLFDVFCSYPLTHDFAATICGFLILVDSPSVRNAAKLKMKDFLQRLTNALLNATFVFLREGLVIYILSEASFIYLNIEISMTEEGSMKSIQVANAFILRHGSDIDITNLVLNKLVYFAQVESLRETGKPLFEDKIEAWPYGPVERNVYFTFQKYGRNRILKPEGDVTKDERTLSVVDRTARKYGFLTAFDLVGFSHRKNSAWKNVYREGENVEITNDAILASDDGLTFPKNTLASSLDEVNAKWQNTFRILRNA